MTTPPTIGEQQAAAQVRDYAATIGAVVGADAAATETRVGPAPCETSGGEVTGNPFYVQGNWQMPLPAAEHAAVLARLRDDWTAQGFEIKRFHMFSDVEGVVIGQNPADGFELMVESASPPVAVAVIVMTPCYLSPAA